MKYFAFIALLATGLLAAEPLTLKESQKLALQHSESLSIAELHTLIATDKIDEIKGINRPKLNFDASYNWRDVRLGAVRKNPMYGKPDGGGPPQPKELKTIVSSKVVRTGKVSLVVPVYDFGYVANLVSAQQAVVEATVHERDRVRQDLCFGVATQFYRALEGAKLERIVEESISVLERQLYTLSRAGVKRVWISTDLRRICC